MELRIRKKGGVSILDMSGKLSLGEGDDLLRDKFTSLLAAGERRFIFNMTGVRFIDSAGLGETVACRLRGGDEAVIKLVFSDEGRIRDIFRVTGLDSAFEVHDDEDGAVASFPASAATAT